MIEQFITFFSHHWPWTIALLITIALLFLNERFAQKNKPANLSTETAVYKINHEDAIVFDLRDSESFKKAHIINSTRVSKEDFADKRFNKYKDKSIILVCAQGMRSSALISELKALGFSQVSSLHGGISAWQSANLPLIKSKK